MEADNTNFLSRGCCRTPKAYESGSESCRHSCSKLAVIDWLEDVGEPASETDQGLIEVRFKNSRKDFFRCPPGLNLLAGEPVAVESSPGHDIGIVSLAGPLVRRQMSRKGLNPDAQDVKKVYRRAKPADIEKWESAISLEDSTKKRARQIAADLKLDMKINDVEYQGDKTKAIFYYTAEERVDFRELIKIMAENFQVRIEMKQIGVRQEASRLGGTGSCGRELCCSTWLSDFKSVTTGSARTQQLSLNPQKLAGQCGKLKCCLNFEQDTYIDALKEFPDTRTVLKTKAGEASHVKSDIFKRRMWYSYAGEYGKMVSLDIDEVRKIIEQNRKGELPADLNQYNESNDTKTINENNLHQDDVRRFDNKKKKRRR